MTALPVAFKTLLSAFKRAEELDRDPQRENRIVAYHIRFYAITKATKLMTGAPDEQRYIGEQIGLLEKLAPALNIQDGEGKRVCIQQATTLFDRADEIDRAGLADKATAKLFYTAATIYDCLEQFGEQDPEVWF
jgi:vacuolar protein sorting-associated protein VTA1